MPYQANGITSALHSRPTVMEKRVSPDARTGASDTIAQPFNGSVTICSANGSAAIVATLALSVNRKASGQAAAAAASPVIVVTSNAIRRARSKNAKRPLRVARAEALADHDLYGALQRHWNDEGQVGHDIEGAKGGDRNRSEGREHGDDEDVGRRHAEQEDALGEAEDRAAPGERPRESAFGEDAILTASRGIKYGECGRDRLRQQRGHAGADDAEGMVRSPPQREHQQQRDVHEIGDDEHQHAELSVSGGRQSDDQGAGDRNRHD